MKKRNLFYALTAGIALFSACNNNSDEFTPTDDNAAQQLVLQVASSGDGLTTRAGRPLYSSEAKQTIENVKVIICNGTNVVYDTLINDWNEKGAEEYTQNGHGRKRVIELAGSSKLAQGSYTVYAIGYHNNSEYTDITTKIANIKKNGTFNENVQLTMDQSKGNKIGEEIFAGSLPLEITTGKGFKTPVVLNRQVAGAFAYVDEIPYFEDVAKLKLVACDRNSTLVLGQFANAQIPTNGALATPNYVINGANSVSSDKVIYEIDLRNWFTTIQDKNGLINTENWQNPYETSDKGKTNFKKGSVFGGNFVIPFEKKAGHTFELQLTNNSDKVLRTWVVKLPETDGQKSEHQLYKWNSTTFSNASNTDTQITYNIVRNHLYGIGKKTADRPTEPGTDPEPGTDEPQSLNNKQELILQVNDNWELIHSMELD